MATTLTSTPPTARRASAKEIMAFLGARGQVGYPPGITTGAQRGNPIMAYRRAEFPFGSCEAEGSISVRSEGSWARAHLGAKNELAQRAKAANCPRSKGATHIAKPTQYKAGELPNAKASGSIMWSENGPWAE